MNISTPEADTINLVLSTVDGTSQDNVHLLVSGVESIQDYAIFMLDSKGYITTWNEGAKRFKGYEPHEIIDQHFSVFYPQEAINQQKPELALKVATETGRFEEEGWQVRQDGSLFWANVVLTALYNKKDELIGFTKVTRDLTERKHSFDELQRTKEATDAINKELESFSYSVSHDLRAPLRTIDGFTRLVLEDKADQLDQQALGYLERVCKSAQEMGRLIDDLLQLSRLSRADLIKMPINLSEMAEEMLTSLQVQEPDRNVTFRIQADQVATVDPILFRSVMQNLLANAWKFTRGKENVLIEFGSTVQNNGPVYFVRDNGAGFDMTYADKLFGAFQRLHDATEFPGTGIGLASVQRVLLRHGGRIWAEAVVDEGATFYFTL